MDAADALSMWQAEGHIDDALAARLRESLQRNEEPERANKLIWVLVSIGAVLIGGGLLLLIASQWDQSSPARRLLLLLAIYLLTVAGAAVTDRQRLETSARGLWFLSSIAAGVNIFLIGQVFNLPLNYWQGTLLWMLATLAMGWASPSSAQGWLAIPLGLLTLAWIATPSARFFDQAAFLWDEAGIRPLLPVIGLGLVALALLVDRTDLGFLGRPAVAFGLLLVSVPITVSTFHPDAFAWVFQIDLQPLHVVVLLVVAALVTAVWRRTPGSPLAMAFGVVTVLLAALLPQAAGTESFWDGASVPWLAGAFRDSELAFGVYTAVIFAVAVVTILAGQRYGIRSLVNVGFVMVGVMLFSVYVGRIAGELPTSLAVILGGLLLVGGAIFLERKRRSVTETAEVRS